MAIDPGVSALLWLRLRLLLRMNLSGYTRQALRTAPIRLAFILVISFIALLLLASGLGSLLSTALHGASARQYLTPALGWGLSAASVAIFFYALLTLVGTFTYRGDLSLLLLAPLSARLILAEKFLAISGSFSLLMVIIALPSMLGAAAALHAGPMFDLVAVVIVILLPVPPVALAMLLVFAALRWLPPARARALATVLGVTAAALVYVGTQTLPGRIVNLPALGPWDLFPTTWPGHALAALSLGDGSTGAAYLGATIVFAGLLAAVAVDRCAHLLATGWTTYHEIGHRSGKPIQPRERAGLWLAPAHIREPSWPAWLALVRKEWRTVRRDPKLLGQLAYPLFIEGFSFYHAFGLPWQANPQFQGRVGFFFAAGLYLTVTLTAVFLLSILTLPIVNREGRSLYLLSLAPLSARAILLAKWAFCAAPILLLVEGLLAVGVRLLRLNPWQVAVNGASLGMLVIALTGGLLCVGLRWPRVSGEQSKRQVHLMALLVGPVYGVVLCAMVGGLLAGASTGHPHHPWDRVVALISIFGLTGAIIAAAVAVGPSLLRDLLVSDRRPV